MRIALSLLALFTAACSTTECQRCNDAVARHASIFIDTDDDGLPDSRQREVIVFVDSDDDGLPDARRVRVRGEVLHNNVVRPRGNRSRHDRVERALQKLERAIAELRRAMR